MQRRLFIILFSFYFLVNTGNVSSQITVNFNAALHGQTLDGLSFAQIISSYSQNKFAKIKITIRENQGGIAATMMIPYLLITPGSNMINRVEFSRSGFQFAQSAAGQQIRQTGRMPEGEYEFCFEVTTGNPKTQAIEEMFENCFSSMIQPPTPLILINPAPEDESCNTRPNFTWQPPMPFNSKTRYRIIVCEKEEKQSDLEAINYNIPVINVAAIPAATLFFPPKIPDLKKEKNYVWQVTAYQDKTIITKSEIWEFSVKCKEEEKKDDGDSYRELKEEPDGSLYYAYNKLRFSFFNPNKEGPLEYNIQNLSDTKDMIKKLPELKMISGFNQFELDLGEVKGFKADKNYLLKVRLNGNRILQLRFVYKETN
jgi:hypothetical protein